MNLNTLYSKYYVISYMDYPTLNSVTMVTIIMLFIIIDMLEILVYSDRSGLL